MVLVLMHTWQCMETLVFIFEILAVGGVAHLPFGLIALLGGCWVSSVSGLGGRGQIKYTSFDCCLVLCWVSLASGLVGHCQNVCTLSDWCLIQSYFGKSNWINSPFGWCLYCCTTAFLSIRTAKTDASMHFLTCLKDIVISMRCMYIHVLLSYFCTGLSHLQCLIDIQLVFVMVWVILLDILPGRFDSSLSFFRSCCKRSMTCWCDSWVTC